MHANPPVLRSPANVCATGAELLAELGENKAKPVVQIL